MRLSYILCILVGLLSQLSLLGQSAIDAELSPYKQAQALVADQQIPQAIQIIEQYKETQQLDRDYQIFLARLYFWNREVEPAIENIDLLLKTWPTDYQAHILLIDIYESRHCLLYTSPSPRDRG